MLKLILAFSSGLFFYIARFSLDEIFVDITLCGLMPGNKLEKGAYADFIKVALSRILTDI